MAVKPITNKQVVASANVNRAKQTTTKNMKDTGNRSKSYIPGADYTQNYSITLKDIDTSIMGHVKDVIKPKVREANETLKIPVFYGNEELTLFLNKAIGKFFCCGIKLSV